MTDRISFTVDLTPPNLNHYVRHTRDGRHYVTQEAKAFKSAVAVSGRHKFVSGKTFTVSIKIVLGAKQRLDVDGGVKLVLDGLAAYGAFQNMKGEIVSDAYVRCLMVILDCDSRPERGYTEIVVERLK